MAKKKSVKKKAKKKAVVQFPSYRMLGVNKLEQVGACFRARLAFVTAFQTFGDVEIRVNTVKHLTDDQVLKFGYPDPSFILNEDGVAKFQSNMERRGVRDWGADIENGRQWLSGLARYYIRYPVGT